MRDAPHDCADDGAAMSSTDAERGDAPAEPDRSSGRLPERRRPPRPKLSTELIALSRDEHRERISVADLTGALGRRSFGAMMLIFAAPNILPTPPGASGVLGAPLIFLAAQLMLGLKPWLPRFIASRSMRREDFAGLVDRATPWLERAERLLRPRWIILSNGYAEYLIGALCLILAVTLALPIPLGNVLPALAICIFALGLLERDGVWVLAGIAASTVAMTIAGGVAFAMIKATIFIIQGAFA